MDKKQGSMINDIYDAPQSQLLQWFLKFFCSNLAILVMLLSRHMLFCYFACPLFMLKRWVSRKL